MRRCMRGVAILLLGLAMPAEAISLPEPPDGLNLERALDVAMAHNPQLLAAKADLKRVEAEAAAMRLNPMRAVSANVGMNSTFNGLPAPAIGAYLTWNLGEWLSMGANADGAEARVEAARQALRATTLQVVLTTTAAHAAWETQQKLLGLRQAAIKASQSDQLVVERLFGKGTASINDLMKARLASSQSQVDLAQSEGEYRKAWSALLAQMGKTDWVELKDAGRKP